MLIKPLILDTRHISSFLFQWKRIENVWVFYLGLMVKLIEQLATQIVFQMKDQEWQSFIHFMSGTDEREPAQRSFSNAFHSYKKKKKRTIPFQTKMLNDRLNPKAFTSVLQLPNITCCGAERGYAI